MPSARRRDLGQVDRRLGGVDRGLGGRDRRLVGQDREGRRRGRLALVALLGGGHLELGRGDALGGLVVRLGRLGLRLGQVLGRVRDGRLVLADLLGRGAGRLVGGEGGLGLAEGCVAALLMLRLFWVPGVGFARSGIAELLLGLGDRQPGHRLVDGGQAALVAGQAGLGDRQVRLGGGEGLASRSALSATARTWPFATVSPTFTLTELTGHVDEPPEPLEVDDDDEMTKSCCRRSLVPPEGQAIGDRGSQGTGRGRALGHVLVRPPWR